jgi:hypothetical protein
VTPAQACGIANRAKLTLHKHWRELLKSFCRFKAERIILFADLTMYDFVLFRAGQRPEFWVRSDFQVLVATIIKLIPDPETVGRPAVGPLIETLEGLVREAIGWPWRRRA